MDVVVLVGLWSYWCWFLLVLVGRLLVLFVAGGCDGCGGVVDGVVVVVLVLMLVLVFVVVCCGWVWWMWCY